MPITNIESQEEFKKHLAKAKEEDKTVVVDFYATWCGPCKVLAPYFVELSDSYTDVIFLKVDVDECDELAAEYTIEAMPTFLLFKDEKVVDKLVGASKDKLKTLVEKNK